MPLSTGPLNVFLDSGVPKGTPQYTTLVMIHGYAWHSPIFSKLLPLAEKYNIRILLLNRRDYPESQPYSEVDLALLRPVEGHGGEVKTLDNLWAFTRDRALELDNWLAASVKDGEIRPFDTVTKTGGAVLAGWSLGSIWMMSLLAHGDLACNVNGVDLRKIVRRVVLYDPPYQVLGYHAQSSNPLFDTTLSPEQLLDEFPRWVTGYYDHGTTPEDMEYQTPMKEPLPTLFRLTPQEREAAVDNKPGRHGGSDYMLIGNGLQFGLFERMHDAVFYPAHDMWRGTELRYIWCDQSVSDILWGMWRLREEIDEAKKTRKRMRPVTIVRVRQANHFVHWDDPKSALDALMGDADDDKVNRSTRMPARMSKL
ncbi:hypothetical protein GY45DRAFT_949227 [Cubamyces sp. BRFM 1775]|nr:hypothetical protein GY45DRAFT_949227 [Cubamyces sp. BRFM 1775]